MKGVMAMVTKTLTAIVRSTQCRWSFAASKARLFYNYLRFSPSYAAGCAHKLRKSRKKLNKHGRTVLASVDKYCDVHRLSFNDWIQGPGCVCLTVPKILPEFLTADTLKVGHQSDIYLRFPFGRNGWTVQELMTAVSAMVPSISRNESAARLTPVVQKNLWRDIYLSYLIKNYPEAELWRIGAEAMLVERFIGKVEPTGRRMNSSQDYERRLLVATVLRHKAWAHNISEYAAMDQFPCKDPLPFEQQFLDLQGVNLNSNLAPHSLEESLYARQQVILCTGSIGRVSLEPSIKHQGVLF